MAGMEEYANKISLADYFPKRTECKEWDQYEENDEACRDELLDRAAAKFRD
jgi:hypothetical protein